MKFQNTEVTTSSTPLPPLPNCAIVDLRDSERTLLREQWQRSFEDCTFRLVSNVASLVFHHPLADAIHDVGMVRRWRS